MLAARRRFCAGGRGPEMRLFAAVVRATHPLIKRATTTARRFDWLAWLSGAGPRIGRRDRRRVLLLAIDVIVIGLNDDEPRFTGGKRFDFAGRDELINLRRAKAGRGTERPEPHRNLVG